MKDPWGNQRGACKRCRCSRPGICREYQRPPGSSLDCNNCGCRPYTHYILDVTDEELNEPSELQDEVTTLHLQTNKRSNDVASRKVRIRGSAIDFRSVVRSGGGRSEGNDVLSPKRRSYQRHELTKEAVLDLQQRLDTVLGRQGSSAASPRPISSPGRQQAGVTNNSNSSPRPASTGTSSASIQPPHSPHAVVASDSPLYSQNIVSLGKVRKKFSLFNFSSEKLADKLDPIFGSPLTEVAKRGSIRGVPTLMYQVLEHLERVHTETEGLFRVAGAAGKVSELVAMVNNGELIDVEQQDPHDLCSFLSRFLEMLPDPLLTYDLYDSFMELGEIAGEGTEREKMYLLAECVTLLPDAHQQFLKMLVALVLKVAQKRHINKMGIPNIAIVFAPLILRDEQLDPRLALADAISAHRVVSYIFTAFYTIRFEGLLAEKERTAERKKRRKASEEWRIRRANRKPSAKDFAPSPR